MDILCTRCGEPWDLSSLTDDMTLKQAEYFKAGKGCPCCGGKEPCTLDIDCMNCANYKGYVCTDHKYKVINQDACYIQSELAGILGDDIDGLAAMMEDTGLI